VVDTVIESELLSTMVLYRPNDSNYLWVRPYQMFTSEVTRDGVTYQTKKTEPSRLRSRY
jgi:hypothetical protein